MTDEPDRDTPAGEPAQTHRSGILRALAILAATAIAGAALTMHQTGSWYLAQLLVRERVVPLTWSHEPFAPTTWNQTPRHERWRFARDLRDRLDGATRVDAVTWLGPALAEGDSHLVQLARTHEANLWFILQVRFVGDRVAEASIRLAWLDP